MGTDLSGGPRPCVVVVGAGFGGLYAARALAASAADVIIIDRRNHHLFKPLLYQVASAGLSPGDIAYPIRALFSRQKNARVLLAEVTGVDVEKRRVILRDGDASYDYLIVAAGATNNYFGHAEWVQRAPALNTLEEALDIRRRTLLAFEKAERETDPARRRALLTFIIVGGGPTGVEMGGAVAEIAFKVLANDFRSINPRETRIVLIEAGPRLLPSFPEELATKAADALRNIGVEIRTRTSVTSIEGDRVRAGDTVIESATVIWAAGVKASDLAKTLPATLDRSGRVLVQSDLTIPGHPEIHVIGDMASFVLPSGTTLPGVAQVAIQQGKHAAENILRAIRGEQQQPFHYKNYGNMATIGRAYAVADFGWLHLSGFLAWLVWLVVHIFWLIGFRNRVVVFFEWAWAYFTFQRAARLITGAPE